MLILLLISSTYANESFSITDEPSHVFQGSTQTISWSTNLTLNEVRIDLYKDSNFIKKLGETNKDTRTFSWKVSDTAKTGDNYFIKVSVKASNGKSAWANTNTFEIISNFNKNDLFYLLLLMIPLTYYCCKQCNKNNYINRYNDPMLPVAQPTVATNPPIYQTQYTTNPINISRGNTSSAARGFAAGFAADELLHHTNHTSWFDSNSSSNTDFGGGDFGGSFFGGGGGDTSGGFS